MSVPRRWDRCVRHRGERTLAFMRAHFGEVHRRVLLIAGAGFDPRASTICSELASVMGPRLQALFLREERPNPAPQLVERAERNIEQLVARVPQHELAAINIFASDGAVIGGRNAVGLLAGRHNTLLEGKTDVIVDSSALSIGVAFPMVRYLRDLTAQLYNSFNLHLMVTDEPVTDDSIVSTASDRASTVHGFNGELGLNQNVRRAKLWLPQLVAQQRTVMERIRVSIEPDDICPIVPFPSADPRAADRLIEHYQEDFDNTWGVDSRDLVYADERNPLDLYRSILRIAAERTRVFAQAGGSMVILSPKGSKVLATGALMAALEGDFPIAYVEASAYSTDFTRLDFHRAAPGEIVHIWLEGEAYRAAAQLGES